MGVEKVKEYFSAYGKEKNILEFATSSATVALAALTLGVEEARIAKTLSFDILGRCCLIVLAGDVKIDNSKFRNLFHCKAKMLKSDEVFEKTGHQVGGVCPFALQGDITVYLDQSLQRFQTVFPAAGSSSSAIELTMEELFHFSHAESWVDVSKMMIEEGIVG